MRSLLLGLAFLTAGCTQTVKTSAPTPDPAESTSDPLTEIAGEFNKGRPREVLRRLDASPERVSNNARGLYLSGYAWLRLHRPDLAKPFLSHAAAAGFNGYPGWESTAALLGRLAEVERLRPPEVEGPKGLRVFADDTPWIRAALKELPAFERRAREVLGEDLPPIHVYLFRSRETYHRFYWALFGVNLSTWWQNGTGDSNIVLYCQEDHQGKAIGPPGAARGLGDILHEYTHALMNTIYGDGYLRHVPQWLDEGLSDFMARPYYTELFESSAVAIQKAIAQSRLPGVEDLTRHLYERDSFLRYAVARYMVSDMMKDREPKQILELLKRASQDGDFEAALLSMMGVSPRQLRDRLVARFH